MKNRMFLIAVMLLSCITSWAQIHITGKVFDENENTLPGAAVFLQSHPETGTVTAEDGSYDLTIGKEGGIISISFMGYLVENVTIGKDRLQVVKDIHLEPDRNFLDEVVVTGTRTPKLLKDAPIITRVISSDDIKKVDATNIADLLQSELPGIEFTYSMNNQVALNMQGFGGNSVLFLVDGERVAGETLDNIDYDRLNLDNVGKIEIVKGAASSLYGSNAVGGVVNLISKAESKPWSVNVNARYGAYNDVRYGAKVGFKVRKVSNSLTFQGVSADEVPLLSDQEGGVSQIYGHCSYNLKDRLVYTPSRKLKFTANLGYFFRQRDAQPAIKDRYRGINGGVKGTWKISPADHLEAAYNYDEYDKSDFYVKGKADIRDYCNVQQTARLVYNHIFREKHTLTLGSDYMNDYLMSYQFTDHGFYRQHTADAFAQFDWNPSEMFNMVAGLRYDYFSEAKKYNLAPKVSFMLKQDNTTLRVSYANGFRAPTLKEMYMNFNMANIFMIYGNKDLKPEVSHNMSASLEYMHRHWNVTATAFYNFVNDRMTTVWNKELNGMVYTNTAPMRIAGLDASVSMKLDCGIGARLSYVYTKEMIEKGHPLLSSTRPHTLTARVDYGHDWKNYGFDIALSGRVLSDVEVNQFSSTGDYETVESRLYFGYSIWKLNFTQRIWNGIRLTLIVDNLFNYKPAFYDNNSALTTGTTASIGLSLDIEEFFNK